MTDLQEAYKYCRSVTRTEAKNFYYAFLTLPKNKRNAIYVIYAFCRYCDDAVDSEASQYDKIQTLHKLRESLTNYGISFGPVFLALHDVIKRFGIPLEYFESLITGMEMDLVTVRYQDFVELHKYCYRAASTVGLMCIYIFGFSDPRAEKHAIDLGLAMQLTNICRDVREDLTLGRVYLPLDEMDRFGCSVEELGTGAITPAFNALMRFQVARARRYFESGLMILKYLDRNSRLCPSVLGSLYIALLDQMEQVDYDVISYRVRLGFYGKIKILFKTWVTMTVLRWYPNQR
jgi:phytoene synthase